jgi:Zn-dependent protease with chaperone function
MSDAVTGPSAEMLAKLTRPTASYKRSAYYAVAGLLAFVAIYFGLAGWFLYTAWRLVTSAAHAGNSTFWSYVGAIVALMLAGFMLKALFAVRSAMPDGLEEVTPKQQPRLFAYLHELADAAGAPRPHRVFVSNRVNAAVFYDLSLVNLIFPTKKNLEIGLPLVNALPLGELRAVLAHEFGHFAQRSMAVGRWVYLAQQIVQQVINRRDKFDAFIDGLGRLDIRLLPFAWMLQLVVWSIRSLVESAFHLLVMLQSALSREMEMQADLVAVSLTGSDALIHALHRLRAADDAWDRTLGFLMSEHNQGRPVRDAYGLQRQITWRMAAILDDQMYGNVPPLPSEQPQEHRVFKPELGQPPKMWQSHPQNHEREQNAKRQYVWATIDQTSAWTLFDHAAGLRENMTARLVTSGEDAKAPVSTEETLARLGHYYGREQYHSRYCGVYFARHLARHVATVGEMSAARDRATPTEAGELYPQSLADAVRTLRQLQGQSSRTGALIAGHLTMEGAGLQFDGREYQRRELPGLKRQLDARIGELERELHSHDAQCRRVHHTAALQLGQGWPEYLESLLAVLHYAEHTSADLCDAYGLVQNTFSVVVAVRRQSKASIDRLLADCMALRDVLETIYRQSVHVEVDAELAAGMEISASWAATLGEFNLPYVSRENINDWLKGVASWVRFTDNWLQTLRMSALQRLLLSEALVLRMARQEVEAAPAPAPCRMPKEYAVLVPGRERQLQTSLSWWARFQRADGWLAGSARLAVAGAIVVTVLLAGAYQSGTNVMVYNGLGTAVHVTIDGNSSLVPSGSHMMLTASPASTHRIEARSDSGVIESFDADDGDGRGVYNIAGAAPLVQWQAVYGPNQKAAEPRMLGALRWTSTSADVLFEEPPKTVSSKTGLQRTVLDSVSGDPARQLALAPDDAQREAIMLAHARWDRADSARTYEWLQMALAKGHAEILEQRLRAQPGDVMLRRLEQDVAQESPEVCAAARQRSAAQPGDGDLYYLALRCNGGRHIDPREVNAALERWPKNAWLKNMMLRHLLEKGDLEAAEPLALQLIGKLPYPADEVELELARIQRFTRGTMTRSGAVPPDGHLDMLLSAERGKGKQIAPDNAYAALGKGDLFKALACVDNVRDMEPRMQRLVGASEGAASMQARRALDMPLSDGLDQATVLTTAALALRQQRDAAPYFKASQAIYGELAPKLEQFLQLANQGRFADAERALEGVPLVVRGLAYSAGVVLTGPMAPQQWRKGARSLLFAPERPYFRA